MEYDLKDLRIVHKDDLPAEVTLSDIFEHIVILRNDPEASELVGIVLTTGCEVTNVVVGNRVTFAYSGGQWFDVPGDFRIFVTIDENINRVLS